MIVDKQAAIQYRHSLRGSVDWNYRDVQSACYANVTPFVGVWIEIKIGVNHFVCFSPSLPSWECGLKLGFHSKCITAIQSLPSWECGLKFLAIFGFFPLRLVTPFVGVWIEIDVCTTALMLSVVSLPSWECGLKFVCLTVYFACDFVTPFVGVWIEMYLIIVFSGFLMSLPSWECGLKLDLICFLWVRCLSLPSWECGLKYVKRAFFKRKGKSHSLRGSVDWNYVICFCIQFRKSHSLRGSVDWNTAKLFPAVPQ